MLREEEAAAAAPKKLVNTDGEALVMTTDHFELEAPAHAEVRGRLIRIEGVEHEEDGEAGARFTVFKQGNAVHAHWDNTVLAHLTLGSDRLRLDTNSVERADRLRARLEAGCGALLRHAELRIPATPFRTAPGNARMAFRIGCRGGCPSLKHRSAEPAPRGCSVRP